MSRNQSGFIRGDIITIVIAGLVLFGLLVHSATTGQELPFWPTMAVIVVNLVAAAKTFFEAKKARGKRQTQLKADGKNDPSPR